MTGPKILSNGDKNRRITNEPNDLSSYLMVFIILEPIAFKIMSAIFKLASFVGFCCRVSLKTGSISFLGRNNELVF